MVTKVHIDLETYSEAPFGKKKDAVGLDVYAKHPSTEILMYAYAQEQDPVIWFEGPIGVSLRTLAQDPNIQWHAFNAPFERTILREVAGIDIPIERWRCTMVHAYHLGFSGTLGDVGKQLGIPEDKQKLARGRYLINKFCSPAPRNHLTDRYTIENAPDDWFEFKEYNIQDVVAEREIGMLLDRYPMPQSEWDLWFVDQRINDRGLPVDRELVEAALEVYHDEKRHLTQLLKERTGLANPNSRDQMLAWLRGWGYPYDNLQADTVRDALHLDGWGTAEVKETLELKQQAARTAGSKWESFKRCTDWDTGRLRHCFQFNGAQRTCRWAGRNVQPHNLHRSPEDQDEKVRSVL